MKAKLSCISVTCLLPMALMGCKAEQKSKSDTAAAFGEVLPGSVSDDMLPYDSLRSRPPLAAVPVLSESDSNLSEDAVGKSDQAPQAKVPESASEDAAPATDSDVKQSDE